jgi:hypothetical protein
MPRARPGRRPVAARRRTRLAVVAPDAALPEVPAQVQGGRGRLGRGAHLADLHGQPGRGQRLAHGGEQRRAAAGSSVSAAAARSSPPAQAAANACAASSARRRPARSRRAAVNSRASAAIPTRVRRAAAARRGSRWVTAGRRDTPASMPTGSDKNAVDATSGRVRRVIAQCRTGAPLRSSDRREAADLPEADPAVRPPRHGVEPVDVQARHPAHRREPVGDRGRADRPQAVAAAVGMHPDALDLPDLPAQRPDLGLEDTSSPSKRAKARPPAPAPRRGPGTRPRRRPAGGRPRPPR